MLSKHTADHSVIKSLLHLGFPEVSFLSQYYEAQCCLPFSVSRERWSCFQWQHYFRGGLAALRELKLRPDACQSQGQPLSGPISFSLKADPETSDTRRRNKNENGRCGLGCGLTESSLSQVGLFNVIPEPEFWAQDLEVNVWTTLPILCHLPVQTLCTVLARNLDVSLISNTLLSPAIQQVGYVPNSTLVSYCVSWQKAPATLPPPHKLSQHSATTPNQVLHVYTKVEQLLGGTG